MARSKNTTYISVCLPNEEKSHLDELVKASGKNRNRYLRDLIAKQQVPKE